MDCREHETRHSLCRTLATVRLLEDALVVPGLASLARGTVFRTDALHLESSAHCASPGGALRGEGHASNGRHTSLHASAWSCPRHPSQCWDSEPPHRCPDGASCCGCPCCWKTRAACRYHWLRGKWCRLEACLRFRNHVRTERRD